MTGEGKHTDEEVERLCAEIRRHAELENARWQLRIGQGGLACLLVLFIVLVWGDGQWSWWWLFTFAAPVMLVVNGRRVMRGKKMW